jgi:SAM domain (Sterile alpha motif)
MTARGTADKVRIARWLKQQGLAQYARAFKEHHIGFDVLPELRDEDLKELGVPLGDRKRLLSRRSPICEWRRRAPTMQ